MANSKPTTSVNLDGPSVQRSAEPGAFASGDQEPFKVMDQACAWMKAKWEEERLSERLTISMLEQRVLQHERVIDEQKTALNKQQTEIYSKDGMIAEQQASAADSQRRIQELEAHLAEEQRRVAALTARNAKLMQVTESFRGVFAVYAQNRDVVDELMNAQGDAGNPVRTIPDAVLIAASAVVAAEEQPVAFGAGSAESPTAPRDPAAPPSAPVIPVETIDEHAVLDTQRATPPPPPAADAAASTDHQGVAADTAIPPAFPISASSERTTAPPAYPSIRVTLRKVVTPALVYRSPSEDSAATQAAGATETRPPKTVGCPPVPESRGKRKRAQSVLAVSTCPVCQVEYADAEDLRRHACPLLRRHRCRAAGCHKRFSSDASRRRHESKFHAGQPKPGSAE
ncbi:protein diaphanous homolog 1-like [Paramacrobiotus metropolitanus]|uniref:protein diaphanous homolog 1-like n=1 Tax=Paramacrobiotus metropolitanus TaxID=2943436 RepID=UPI002445B0B1|nr:protein diaphanous homolog 1-like [Paramacrobiotus metropolitanus]